MTDRSVILLEFNELCPPLMKKFMAAGHLPNFSRFHGEAMVATTVADEVAPFLDPWIQWITVHSGVPYKGHKIRDLGDGHLLDAPNLWDLVSARGGKSVVCGSMNTTHRPGFRGWYVPDPWTTKVAPEPDDVTPYFRFVKANVTEYTSDKIPLRPTDYAKFMAFMATHGLSRRTVTAIAKQLAWERVNRKQYWRRAVILDKLQMDLFKWAWRKERPAFASFFLNSTAHFQHLYWRHMDPGTFKVQPKAEDLAVHRDSILFGYKEMDALLGEVMDFAGRETTIVFATAFSQQPFLAYEDVGGKTPYRPIDFDKFLKDVGIGARAKVSPVMTHQFHLDFASEEAARDAMEKLSALSYEGKPLMGIERTGAKLFGGCIVYRHVPRGAVVMQGSRTIPFFDLLYHVDLVKSGMHHPDGMFWVRTPARQHSIVEGKVPIVNVAPTLCRLLGIEPPATMVGSPIGEGRVGEAAE
jgi:hypothetical protein